MHLSKATETTAHRYSVACTLSVIHAIGLLGVVQPSSANESPTFEETACDLPAMTAELEGRFRCGFVRVPQVYSDDASGELRLFVAIAQSPRQPAEPDPIVIVSGGPGNSATQVATVAGPDLHSFPIAPRDVIFIDQRGTGQSEPRICALSPSDGLAPLAADRAIAEAAAQTRAIWRACLDALDRHGVPPEAWGAHVTAEDFETVRRALGIARWNVLSVSYGTSVAMELAARYPDTLRSLMLDSVVPPDPMPLDPRVSFLMARDALFSLCARDRRCARAYPNLPELYARALERLDAAPIAVPVAERLELPGNRFVLNRGDFEMLFFLSLYYRDAYAELPSLIRAAVDGRADPFVPIIEGIAGMVGDLSVETYTAVGCRDMPTYHSSELLVFGLDLARLGAACSEWARPGPIPQIPVGTEVPTLIFAGTMDPITPPINGVSIARQIGSSARLVLMQHFGHAPVANEGLKAGVETCGETILASFLNDPSQPLDISCADAPTPIEFR
jgi:pimeloyl-ACP methyl ester carboxylesterase